LVRGEKENKTIIIINNDGPVQGFEILKGSELGFMGFKDFRDKGRP
jgi:hypothetical protein